MSNRNERFLNICVFETGVPLTLLVRRHWPVTVLNCADDYITVSSIHDRIERALLSWFVQEQMKTHWAWSLLTWNK